MYQHVGNNSQPNVPSTTCITSPARGVVQSQRSQAPLAAQPSGDLNLHAEIRAVLELYEAHSHKIYFSGPLVRRCEPNSYRQTRGVSDEQWVEAWAQLGGTCLSIWILKEIEAASKQGREVPPSYTNVTDSVRFHWRIRFLSGYFFLKLFFIVYTNSRISNYSSDTSVSS
jgi:hypothetical protein